MSAKYKAFLLHLAVSAVAAAALVTIAVVLWFPPPFFVADGGWQGIRLVVAIHVVLGPCLTLVVYNRRKSWKSLAFDYLAIGVLQIGVIGFGIWTVFSQRTVMVIFADGTFYSVDAQTATRLGDPAAAILAGAEERPAFAVIDLPEDLGERQALRAESLATGRPLFQYADLLRPMDEDGFREVATMGALDIEKTVQRASGGYKVFEDFLGDYGGDPRQLVYVPCTCRYEYLVLALDPLRRELAGWIWMRSEPPHVLLARPPAGRAAGDS